jgi:serine/threonine protein kinase
MLRRQSGTTILTQVHIEAGVGDHELLLLEREINLHTGVDHPHIIKLWDTLIEEGTVYMIMELAENGTLFSYQTKNRKIG